MQTDRQMAGLKQSQPA